MQKAYCLSTPLGPLKTFISACVHLCVCAKMRVCMREREREGCNSRAVDS